MLPPSWLRQLRRRLFPRRAIQRTPLRHRVRPCLEVLEDRTVPSAVNVAAGDMYRPNGPSADSNAAPAYHAGPPISGITTNQGGLLHSATTPTLGAFVIRAAAAPTATMVADSTTNFSASDQHVTLLADVTSNAVGVNEGTVTFTVKQGNTVIGTATTSGTVNNGVASVSYDLPGGTPPGGYIILASYNPGPDFTGSSGMAMLAINKTASTTTTTSNVTANFSSSAQDVTLTADVTSNGVGVNEGTVTFTVKQGNTVIGTATTSGTVNNGQASVSYVLPAGTAANTYTLDAVYNPGPGFAGSEDNTHTLTVSAAPTTTTTTTSNVTANFSSSAQDVTLTADVTSNGVGVNEGTVTFTVKQVNTVIGTATTSGTLSNGQASVRYILPGGTPAGIYTIDAAYNTGPDFTASSGTATLTINGTTTTASDVTTTFSTSAQHVTLTADVTSNGVGVNEGTVTFTVKQGNTVIGTATTSGTVNNGQASVSYVLPAGTAANTYTLDAVYNPGPDFAGSEDNTHTLTVSAAPTTTAASDVTTTFNVNTQSVMLTADVTSNNGGVNEGTVTFTIKQGNTVLGTATTSGTLSNGQASVSYVLPTAVPSGSYTIDAVYNPGADFTGSSGTATLTIKATTPASTTTTASNAAMTFSASAQHVTLTADVTSNGVGVNEGTVTFTVKQGNTVIGTATTSGTVSNGQASVSYDLPGGTPAGTYTIDAVYNPGPDFTGISGTATLTAIAAPTTTTAGNVAVTFSNGAQDVMLSATVTSDAGAVNEGTVTFTIRQGGIVIGTATTSGAVSNGQASVIYVLPGGAAAGGYTLDAAYNPGADFTASSDAAPTLTVAPQMAAIQFTTVSVVPNLFTLTQTETITVHVFSAGGGVNQGTVTFTVNGRNVNAAVDGNGNAMVQVTLPLLTAAFPQHLAAAFNGPDHLPANTTQTALWWLIDALLPAIDTFAADGSQSVQSYVFGLPFLDFLYTPQGQLKNVIVGPGWLILNFS